MSAVREVLTSAANPRVKHLTALRERRHRRRHGTTLVEGVEETRRAIAAGADVRGLYVAVDAAGAPLVDDVPVSGDLPVVGLDVGLFERLAVRGAGAGVIAEVADPTVTVDALRLPADPLVLVVEGVEKPGNLGAMLRTADAVGVDAVIIADPTTDATNPNVVRASLGCLFTVPVAVTDTPGAIAFLAERGIAVCAALVDAREVLWDVDLAGAVAVVIGTEHDGLSEPWRDAATRPVRIPMAGAADSLNAATSAAVILYEAARQRG